MRPTSPWALGWGIGLAIRFGQPQWAIAGFAIGLGWAGLSLHNDCRYKAFFQRLKSATGSYRVDGGGGGRPQPPAPWPRRGRAALTWPAFKACEIHVIDFGTCRTGVARDRQPGGMAFPLASLGDVHGGSCSRPGHRPHSTLGALRRGRVRIRALVSSARGSANETRLVPPERRPLDTEALAD